MSSPLLPPGYRIRPGRRDELDALVEIERAAAALFRPFGLDEVMASVVTPRDHLERGADHGGLLVVEHGTSPVGFALVSALDGDAHLEELDVRPAHGRRGLGRALVVATIALARREGRPRVTLSTLRHIPWNAPWYARLGFREMRLDEIGPELAAACTVDRERGLPEDGRVLMSFAISYGEPATTT